MNAILTILLTFSFLTHTPGKLGPGVVEVNIDLTKEIKVFKNKGDKTPERILRLIKQGGEIAIEEKDYQKWLVPESISLDYYIFLFQYTQIKDNWIEVIINKSTGEKRWIENSPTLEVIQWETFLITNTTAVEPVAPIEIKAEPNSSSKTIRQSSDLDCFEALEINGEWIKIRTNETLHCNEHPHPVKSGWIKWRTNNQMVIRYYLTC